MLRSTAEVLSEQRAGRLPPEPGELGLTVGAQLVRRDGPARQLRQHLVHAREHGHVVRVVVREVVTDLDAEAGALVDQQRPETNIIEREPESKVGLDQRAVGVDERAVEVEHDPAEAQVAWRRVKTLALVPRPAKSPVS